jgi:hypothetical protein
MEDNQTCHLWSMERLTGNGTSFFQPKGVPANSREIYGQFNCSKFPTSKRILSDAIESIQSSQNTVTNCSKWMAWMWRRVGEVACFWRKLQSRLNATHLSGESWGHQAAVRKKLAYIRLVRGSSELRLTSNVNCVWVSYFELCSWN